VRADYFVKLVDAATGTSKVSYFVQGGSVVTTHVPNGVFTVKDASGRIWCGEKFGTNMAVQKGTRPATFDEAHTYELFLTPQSNGDFQR
jgi:hypothetical protein